MPAPVVVRSHHLVAALRTAGFRRLFGVRLSAQFGDGVFQASLAGAVLFNPERQAHASAVAAGFAVLLLPYSIVGPFAGVLLDRWSRQRVLVFANVLRAVAVVAIAGEVAGGLHGNPFYASALVVLSISRFFLSALSASLPHVVAAEELVTANALSTTLGALATTAGGASAIGVRLIVGDSSQRSYAAMAAAALVPYVVSAIAARGFLRDALGPDDVERANRETLAAIARGLLAGARHLYSRRDAFQGLCAIGVHRICYGLFAVCTVLLFRNYYSSDGVFRSGLAGLAQLVVLLAAGGGLAALITPALTRRLGFGPWTAIMLATSGAVQVFFVLPYRLPLHLLGALVLGFTAQGIKICVDTLVQGTIADEFRGRVFALYDTLFNLALVFAAVLTALVLPDNGRSPVSVIVLAAAYLVTAVGYFRVAGRRPRLIAADPIAAGPTTA